MKALTICEPYAEYLACGSKTFETRSRPTSYRGPLLIHAGKSKKFMQIAEELGLPEVTPQYGMIVAVGTLVACHLITPEFMAGLSDAERSIGFYAPGRYAWEISNIRKINPIEARGYQSLWNWKGE